MHGLYHLSPTVYFIVQTFILLMVILFWLAMGAPEIV